MVEFDWQTALTVATILATMVDSKLEEGKVAYTANGGTRLRPCDATRLRRGEPTVPAAAWADVHENAESEKQAGHLKVISYRCGLSC